MVSNIRPWTIGLFALLMILALSCSGSGTNPVTPPSGDLNAGLQDTSGSNPSPDPALTGSQGVEPGSHEAAGTAVWGVYDIVYDWATGELVVEPIRGAQFAFNITDFLQPPTGNPANLKITINDGSHLMDLGQLTLTVEITHPLSLPRLVGFDTMGVLIGDGTLTSGEDSGVVYSGDNDLRLLNFDGYTRWMNPVEFTDPGFLGYTDGMYGTKEQTWSATINGYKYFAEGLGATDDLGAYLEDSANQAHRGAFYPGSTNSRRYELQFPMEGGAPQIRFQYAILSHFKAAKDGGVPITDPDIGDFPPEANAQEAIYLECDTSASTLYFDADAGSAGGDLTINITVYDWQGMESVGGAGVLNEISGIGLESKDGLFGVTGMNLAIEDTSITEVSTPLPYSTELSILVPGLVPQKSGENEILVAVYSIEPDTYDQGLGSAYPVGAVLAGYTRATVQVSPSSDNLAPVIDEMQGKGDIGCFDSEEIYTCIAHDPDPGDTLTYTWALTEMGQFPQFDDPPSEDNTYTVDWSDPQYTGFMYQLYCQVSDGQLVAADFIDIFVSESGLIVDPLEAEDGDINGVRCDNIDALYTCIADCCNPQATVYYQWLRGFGQPPAELDPHDPNWTEPSENNTMVYSWDQTDIGNWWIICMVSDPMGGVFEESPFLIVERIDTPPSNLLPPEGATEVDCNSTEEVYILGGGEDCDGGEFTREYTITDTNIPPTVGWVDAVDDQFIVNWSVYPVGVYYAWQRVEVEGDYEISESLEINRVNTGPDTPPMPEGDGMVDCTFTDALYQAGVVGDCEGDPLTREWALGTEETPPETGWNLFTGTTFTIDFSQVPSGSFRLWQRASDDEIEWKYSDPLPVTKINAAPDKPSAPDGAASVTCHDNASPYEMGEVGDCDITDVLTRYYTVTEDPFSPFAEWIEFTETPVMVDWSMYQSGMWYVVQKVTDGQIEAQSDGFAVIKGNTTPDVEAPTGPIDADCTSTDVEYTEGAINDCDPDTMFFKSWYLSTDPVTPTGGLWTPYEGSTFTVDFSFSPNGDLYLFTNANDGEGEGISPPLHITRHNTAPDKPATPDGPTEVDCLTNPATYTGGELSDCDKLDVLTRSHYLSTDPVTPTGGSWIDDIGDLLFVDYNGVVAEQAYWLFQKASDGELETLSDPLAVIYHNTAPSDPPAPLGATEVSCANDNEEYFGGEELEDCDGWQVLTRSWAISDIDWPPAVDWTEYAGTSWFIDWSEYDQDTYYLFQRVYDGYEYAYSESLQVIVGPPTLTKPPAPIGPADIYCDDLPITYDGSDYLIGCPDIEITRSWAFNFVPTPPLTGWTVFSGNTFDVDPSLLGFGNIYLFQRAQLDLQEQISQPLLVIVHPGALGVPPVPIGATSVSCSSTSEDYDMGTVSTACPGTPLTRSWQVQDLGGDPLVGWQEFMGETVNIDWTTFPTGDGYWLVQMAQDADHTTYSDPLVIDFVNDEPEFLGSISGPTMVNCSNKDAIYDGGTVDDCDTDQTLTREWAWNTIDAYPVDGWQLMLGSSFMIDYSSPDILPGDVYLFQRVSDGIVTVYDPVSLHVTYTNSPPDTPGPPGGADLVDCTNTYQVYDAGEVSDCDGQDVTREWAISQDPTPPVAGWVPFTGTTFDMDWAGAAFGTWYIYQRASDGVATETSAPFIILYINTPPSIETFECVQGPGPFDADGIHTGLTGLNLVDTLDFNFVVSECDGEDVDVYWAATSFQFSPPEGDPSWNGPITGSAFQVDTSDYTDAAPGRLFIHIGASDGTNFVAIAWSSVVNMWDFVWMTEFTDPGDMWTEDPCVVGTGSYTWSHDAGSGYLRLEDYGAGSNSAVWGPTVALPAAPGAESTAKLISYLNPGFASGFDNMSFQFLEPVGCDTQQLDLIIGQGCDSNSPQLGQYTIHSMLPIWNTSQKIGISENGFDGCTDSEFYLDWAGIWIMPN